MNRAWYHLLAAGIFLSLTLGNGFCAATRPDLVIFLTDDLGQLDTTPYGGQGIRTPNIQRLADAGMTFTRAYVTSPSCAPSRAALLTGLMPARSTKIGTRERLRGLMKFHHRRAA